MYNLETQRVIDEIRTKNSKKVLIQLPDGLKPKAAEIVKAIEDAFPLTKVYIWLSSCYGGCDLPLGVNTLGVDLIVQYGHNIFHREDW